MKKYLSYLAIFILTTIVFSSCTKKQEIKTEKDNRNALITITPKDTSVTFKYRPKTGDVFKHKAEKYNKVTEEINFPKPEKVVSESKGLYFTTLEVLEVGESGAVTFKARFDSLLVEQTSQLKDSTVSIKYNSNVKDTSILTVETVLFDNLVGNNFKIRVSENGEILDTYETEKIVENVLTFFKNSKDERTKEITEELNKSEDVYNQQKQLLKGDVSNTITSIFSQIVQELPKGTVPKDSTWTKIQKDEKSLFNEQLIVNYSITEVKSDNQDALVTIAAVMTSDYDSKPVKDKKMGVTVSLEDFEAKGTGKLVLDLNRGVVKLLDNDISSHRKFVQKNSRGDKSILLRDINIKYKVELIN
ncbi:MAG: DUF6263 family protein [Ignavibacteria bacterium]